MINERVAKNAEQATVCILIFPSPCHIIRSETARVIIVLDSIQKYQSLFHTQFNGHEKFISSFHTF